MHLLTNYHVSFFLEPGTKIEGVPVESISSATGPDDQEARQIEGLDRSFLLRFSPQRDLSLLRMRKPLPARFRGLPFATYSPQLRQQVTGLAYRNKKLNVSTGEILAVRAVLNSTQDSRSIGEISTLVVNFAAAPGNSGGAIFDSDGLVIGIIYGAQVLTDGGQKSSIATLALPVASISRFLRVQDPELWARVFLGRTIMSATEAKELAERLENWSGPSAGNKPPVSTFNTRLKLDAAPVVPANSDAEAMIASLKAGAKANLARMHNLLAEQNVETWGDDQPRQYWRHEVAIYGNRQTFREINGYSRPGKLLNEMPYPKNGGIRPGGEWYHLLKQVVRADMRYLGVSRHNEKLVHLYEFGATAKQKVCYWAEVTESFGSSATVRSVDCAGQVIADADLNTLEISTELYPWREFPDTSLVNINVAYEFVKIEENAEPPLVPTSIWESCQGEAGDWHFASGSWKDYHRFAVHARIVGDFSVVKSAADDKARR